MLPETKDDIEYEFQQIEKELELTSVLKENFKNKDIDEFQLRASVSLIHSIYNGIEKIIIMIHKDLKITIPENARWHSELLKTAQSQKVISEKLHNELRKYMSFRHFYRHSYGFMLDLDLIYPLIRDSREIIIQLKKEIFDGA